MNRDKYEILFKDPFIIFFCFYRFYSDFSRNALISFIVILKNITIQLEKHHFKNIPLY